MPGVAGIGPKTASELINKFGSLDALLAAAAAGGVPGKRGIAIHEAREAVRVSRELVRLREDVPLPKPIAELHRIDPDKKQLRQLFTELEFSRLVDQLSASGAAAIAPHAEGTPAPVVTGVPESVAPAAPPPRVPAIAKREELEALAAEIRAAGAVGLAALYDGPSAGGRTWSESRSRSATAAHTCRSRTATWAHPRAFRKRRRWPSSRRCSPPPTSRSTSTTRRRWRCC